MLTVVSCTGLDLDTAEVRSIDLADEPPTVLALEGVSDIDESLPSGEKYEVSVEFEMPSNAPSYAASFFADGLNYGVRVEDVFAVGEGMIVTAQGVLDKDVFDGLASELCE